MQENDQIAFRRHRSKQEYEHGISPRELLYDINISGDARILMMAIYDLGSFAPETLRIKLGMSEKQFDNAYAELEKSQWLLEVDHD